MIVEKPLAFGRTGSLVGIVAAPADGPAADTPTVVFVNAGIIHRIGPNRLYVRLARELARRGVPSLRFDLGGIGDSATGRDERGSILEIVERDLGDAIDLAVRQSGSGSAVLVGLCSGADNGLQAAVRDERVVGVVQLDPATYRPTSFFVRHYTRALLDPRTWKLLLTGEHPVRHRIGRRSADRDEPEPDAPTPFLAPTALPPRETMRDQLLALTRRGCRLLYVFSGGMPYRYNHGSQFARAFPEIEIGREIQLHYRADWDHTFSDPEWQEDLIELVSGWIVSEFAGTNREGELRSA